MVSSITVTEKDPAMPASAPTEPPIAKISTSLGDDASIETPRTMRPVASVNDGVPAVTPAVTVARPSIHADVLSIMSTLVRDAPTLVPPLAAIWPAIVPACAALRALTCTLPAACTMAAPTTEAVTVSTITLTVSEPATATLSPPASPIAIESIEPASSARTVTLPPPALVSTVDESIVAVTWLAMKLADMPMPTPAPPKESAAPPVGDLMLDVSSASTATSPPAVMSESSDTCASTVSMTPLIASAPPTAVPLEPAAPIASDRILPSISESASVDSAVTLAAPSMPLRSEFSTRAVIVLVTEFQPSAPPAPALLSPIPSAPPTASSTESSCASRVTEDALVSVESTISAVSVLIIKLMPSVKATPVSLLAPAEMPIERKALSFFAVSDRAPPKPRVEILDRSQRVAGDLVEADREPDAGAAAHREPAAGGNDGRIHQVR